MKDEWIFPDIYFGTPCDYNKTVIKIRLYSIKVNDSKLYLKIPI